MHSIVHIKHLRKFMRNKQYHLHTSVQINLALSTYKYKTI